MYRQVWNPMMNAVHEGVIQREADQAFIPLDPGNVDYQEYLEWLNEGNQPHPHDHSRGGTDGNTATQHHAAQTHAADAPASAPAAKTTTRAK